MNETIIILLTTILLLVLSLLVTTFVISRKKEDGIIKEYLRDENYKLENRIKTDNTETRIKIVESINVSSKDSIKDLNEFKDNLNNQMDTKFATLTKSINEQLNNINNKVDLRLNEGFNRTNKTFENIVERLSKIDEAQKNIEKLSTEVVSLQEVLTDKKTRGMFGEVQLNNILESIFGEGNKKIYELQYTFSNNKTADAILKVPEPMGNLAIDSKFPLENYQRMMDKTLIEQQRNDAKKQFKIDLKRHINDIAEKYIITNETADQAVMFIPAEAIFAEINAYHPDIVEYSQKNNVWIASPTTIMSLLTTVQVIIQNVDRNKNMKVIHDELNKLGEEFSRYRTRWDKLARSIKTVTDDVSKIYTTSDKISKRFNAIKKVDFKDIEELSQEQLEEQLEENE